MDKKKEIIVTGWTRLYSRKNRLRGSLVTSYRRKASTGWMYMNLCEDHNNFKIYYNKRLQTEELPLLDWCSECKPRIIKYRSNGEEKIIRIYP